MNEQAQRIAIAEVCGWESIQTNPYTNGIEGIHAGCRDWLPDYINDLNAMHEAEKFIPRELLAKYRSWLREIIVRDTPGLAATEIVITLTRWVFHATAAQRAEAFLRTVGKWETTPTLVESR